MAAGPRPGELLHIPTAFAGYNRAHNGIEIGVCTVVVGHTGDGKSSLMLALGAGAARSGVHTLLFSTEDPLVKTVDRLLAQDTGIPSIRLNRKDVSPTEAAQLASAADLFPARLEIVAMPLGCAELLAATKAWVAAKRRAGITAPLLVIVDYLQALIESANPEQEMRETTKTLNGFAGQESIAIVAASQVRSDAITESKRRFAASRPPPVTPHGWRDLIEYFRPQLGDVEFCRNVEKSAKAVWVWFRPGRWARDFAGWDVEDNVAEIHVLKANFGPTGHSVLKWDGSTQRVYE